MSVDLLSRIETPARPRRSMLRTPAGGYAAAGLVSLAIWAGLITIILG